MKTLPVFLILILLIAFSCGDPNKGSSENSTGIPSGESKESNISALVMERGAAVYKTHCFACHQMNGKGISSHYPPLAENKTITGDKEHLVGILLNGLSGEIEVNGKKYNLVMLPHDFLTDNQIADVLTYIRNSFGNKADAVKTAEVKVIRKRNNLKK